jgi:type IV secretory pathway TrbL component
MRQQFMTLMQTAAMTTNAVTDNSNEYYSIFMITINYSSSHLTYVNIIKQEPLFQSSFTDKNMISDFISFHQQSHLSYSILINQTSILKVNSV